MPLLQDKFVRKRRSKFPHSDDSDSGEECLRSKRQRRYDHEGSMLESFYVYCKNSVTSGLTNVLEWVGKFPLKNYLKIAMFKGAFPPFKAPEVIDIDDSDVEEDMVIKSSKGSSKYGSNGISEDSSDRYCEKYKMGGSSAAARSLKSPMTIARPVIQPLSSTPVSGDFQIVHRDFCNRDSVFILNSSLPSKPVDKFQFQYRVDSCNQDKPYGPITNPSSGFVSLIESNAANNEADVEYLAERSPQSKSRTATMRNSFELTCKYREDSRSDCEDFVDNIKREFPGPKISSYSKPKSFTALERIQLQEKAMYEELLKAVVNNPSRRLSHSTKMNTETIDITDSDDDEGSILSEAFIYKAAQKGTFTDFKRAYFKPFRKNPQQAVKDKGGDELLVIAEKKPSYRPKFEMPSSIFSPEWIEELKQSLVYETEKRNKILSEQEKKTEYYRKKRNEKLEEEKLKMDRLCRSGATVFLYNKSVDFPVLTAQMQNLVDAAFSSHCDISSIFVNSPTLTRNDILTLNGFSWLNDQVMNQYLLMITERSKKRFDLPKVYSHNTFFCTRLLQSGPASVARWTRKVDIFGVDLIIIPLHINSLHWALCVVDNRTKQLTYYDSMEKVQPPFSLTKIREYLVYEKDDKKRANVNPAAYSLVMSKNHPLQSNGSDCGVFTLVFAEHLSRDAPFAFSQENMPYFRRRIAYECLTNKLL